MFWVLLGGVTVTWCVWARSRRMAAATAYPDDHVAMVASWRALAGHTCHPWKGQLSLPAGGTHHCLCGRPRGKFRGLLAAGVAARTAAAARRAGSAIGARKGDRSIMFALRRCSVDSDAVLLRARHGGRHEGGGRRQRKRDEELVHLAMLFCKLEMLTLAQTSDSASIRPPSETAVTAFWRSGEQLQDGWSTPTAQRASKFGRAPAAPETRGPNHRLPSRHRRMQGPCMIPKDQ